MVRKFYTPKRGRTSSQQNSYQRLDRSSSGHTLPRQLPNLTVSLLDSDEDSETEDLILVKTYKKKSHKQKSKNVTESNKTTVQHLRKQCGKSNLQQTKYLQESDGSSDDTIDEHKSNKKNKQRPSQSVKACMPKSSCLNGTQHHSPRLKLSAKSTLQWTVKILDSDGESDDLSEKPQPSAADAERQDKTKPNVSQTKRRRKSDDDEEEIPDQSTLKTVQTQDSEDTDDYFTQSYQRPLRFRQKRCESPKPSTSRSTDTRQRRKKRRRKSSSHSSSSSEPRQLRETRRRNSSPQPSTSRQLRGTRSRAASSEPAQIREKRNKHGETLLHEASRKGDLDTVRELRKKGHSVNVQDYCGWTPLHEAVAEEYFDLTEYLLQQGAIVDHRGGPGCGGITPLIDAARFGLFDMIDLLLEYGADPLIKDKKDMTALDHLKKWKEKQQKKGTMFDVEMKRQFRATVAKLRERRSGRQGAHVLSAKERVVKTLKEELGVTETEINPVVKEYGQKCLSAVEKFFQLKDEFERKVVDGHLRQQEVVRESSSEDTDEIRNTNAEDHELPASTVPVEQQDSEQGSPAENNMDETETLNAVTLAFEKDISIKQQYKCLDLFVSGLQVVSPSTVVLINNVSKLSLYNVENMEMLAEKEYSTLVIDLASVGDNRVAALLKVQKKVHLLSTAKSWFSDLTTIDVDQEYNRIAGCEERLVLCHCTKLLLMDVYGRNRRTVDKGETLHLIEDIAVSRDKQFVYASDKFSVTKINFRGVVLSKFRTDGIHPPTLLQPLSDDSLLVCFTDKNKIERITNDCQKCQIRGLENVRLWSMQGIDYDICKERLYVACANSDNGIPSHIKVFHVKW